MLRLSRLAVIAGLALSSTSGAVLAADLLINDSVEPAVLAEGGHASGFVSVAVGMLNTDFEYDDVDSWAIELAGSGVYQFTPEIGLQGDLVYSSISNDEDYFTDLGNLDGALHLFFRDSSSFLLGGFVQLGTTEFDYGYYTYDITRGYAGIEGQLYLDLLTLYGQVGWQGTDSDGYRTDGVFANVEARYFITDDLRVDLHAGIGTYEGENDGDESTLHNVGIGAEYKFADLPLSVFGKLDYFNADHDFSYFASESVRATVGLKFNFGDETLFDRDRSGPTLKPVEAPLLVYGELL